MNLKVLYLLSNDEVDVLEVKRTDLPPTAPPSDVYHWLCHFKETGRILKLIFASMASQDGVETRQFQNGKLQFDLFQGSLEITEGTYLLKRNPTENVTNGLLKAVMDGIRTS